MTAPLAPPAGALLVRTSTGRVGTMRVKNGRYHDGERSYQRVSNLLKNIETDTWNLDEWRENMLAIGLSMRSDLVLGVAAAAQFDPITGKLTQQAKSTLRGLRKQATDAAKSKAGANTGTAVHTATERLDLGESVEQIGLPQPYDADLRAYEALKSVMGLSYRHEHIERTVRNLTTDNCGSFDRLGSCELLVERGVLAPGELLVVDVKTEGDPLRNMIHIGPQLAEYANSDDMFVPEPRPETPEDPLGPFAGRYEPMPNVSKIVGLMIHVRDGRAVPYLVNLAAGWKSAQRAAEQRDELAASKTPLGNPGAWAVLVQLDMPQQAAADDPTAGLCPNCAPLVVRASVTRVDGTAGNTRCATCANLTPEAPEYAVGDTVTVGGVEFTKHSEPPGIVAAAAARGPMGFSAPAGMSPQQYVATAHLPQGQLAQVVEQSYRGGDGLVRWAPIEQVRPELDKALTEASNPLVRMLAEQVDAAGTMPRLAELFELAREHGVEWSGTIAYLAERRRFVIECAQRELHVVEHGGLCACGWTATQQP